MIWLSTSLLGTQWLESDLFTRKGLGSTPIRGSEFSFFPRLQQGDHYMFQLPFKECVHDGHVGGPKQYNDFPLGNIFYFYANIFYCFSPPTWPPCTHSISAMSKIKYGGTSLIQPP